jgi:hypothetical protein
VTDCIVVPDPTTTLAITTAGSPLEVGPDCPDGTGTWWTAITLPAWAYRNEYAPPSPWLPGQVLLSAVPDQSSLAVAVGAKASTLTALQAQKAALDDALAQWRYTVTLTAVSGLETVTIGSWLAQPCAVVWGDLDTQPWGQEYVAVGSAAIPVNPPGSP